jgi:hypothetical protein
MEMQPEMQRTEVPIVPAPKTAMPTVAGILTLISGGGKILFGLGVFIAGFFVTLAPRMNYRFQNPVLVFSIIAVLFLAVGVLAVIGGIYTLQRKKWGWALASAILALLPFNLLGLASIILVALSKREFES